MWTWIKNKIKWIVFAIFGGGVVLAASVGGQPVDIDLTEQYSEVRKAYFKLHFVQEFDADIQEVMLEKIMAGEEPTMTDYNNLGYDINKVLSAYENLASGFGYHVCTEPVEGICDNELEFSEDLTDLTHFNKQIIRGIKISLINEDPEE